MGTARSYDAEREPGGPDPRPERASRPSSARHPEPVLALQAAAGNAAVTSLLRRTGDIRVQRLWDDEEDEDAGVGAGYQEGTESQGGAGYEEGSESQGGAGYEEGSGYEEGPAPDGGDGGAPDATALSDVESQARADLDPPSVIGALEPYAGGGSGLGDYPMPEDGPTAQAMFVQRDPPDGPGPAPRAGTPGDVLKALMPYLEPALDRLLKNVTDAIARLKTGEKIATVVVLAPIVIAPLTQPGPRRLALDQLNGTDVTFGVVPNLQVKPIITDGELKGGTVTYDLAPALRKLGVPF